jgi:hypothetical protein
LGLLSASAERATFALVLNGDLADDGANKKL